MVTRVGQLCEFRVYAGQAEQVYLAGDFNDWNYAETPMQRTQSGHWQTELELEPGTYKFRYFADGQWMTDYAAFGLQPSRERGGWDSVIYVPE